MSFFNLPVLSSSAGVEVGAAGTEVGVCGLDVERLTIRRKMEMKEKWTNVTKMGYVNPSVSKRYLFSAVIDILGIYQKRTAPTTAKGLTLLAELLSWLRHQEFDEYGNRLRTYEVESSSSADFG